MYNRFKRKLFDQMLSLYGREYSLAVYVMPNSDKTNFYLCVLDDIKTMDLWVNDDGIWIDMQNGSSELCDIIGKIIEGQVLPSKQTSTLIM